MLLFEVCKCPRCSSKFLPDADATFAKYFDVYSEKFPSLLVDSKVAPELPALTVFKCSNLSCVYSQELSDSDVLNLIRKSWSELAWSAWQSKLKSSFNFDKYFTRYLLDGDLGKFITEDELKHNPLLKEYVKLVRDGKAKPTEEV